MKRGNSREVGDHETDEMSSILEVFGISRQAPRAQVGAGIAEEGKTAVRPPWHFDWLISGGAAWPE
jgi:hypothetical protein